MAIRIERTVAMALLLAACGSSGGVTTEGPADDVTGTSWQLIDGVAAVNGYPLTITFATDNTGGHDGCKGWGTFETPSNGQFSLGEVGSEDQGCASDDVATASQRYMAALLEANSYQLDGDRLSVSGPNTELTFTRRAPAEIGALVDITWLLASGQAGGADVVTTNDAGWIRFDSTGTAAGSTGCRAMAGRWFNTPGSPEIQFTDMGMDGSCVPELVAIDSLYTSVIGDGMRFEIVGDSLTILTSPGIDQLTFARNETDEPPPPPSADATVGFDHDPSVTWTVELPDDVEFVLVYETPGGEVAVAEAGNGERMIQAGIETLTVDGVDWRQVLSDANATGWIEDRHLTSSG
jgi:heat shock protein HslJ